MQGFNHSTRVDDRGQGPTVGAGEGRPIAPDPPPTAPPANAGDATLIGSADAARIRAVAVELPRDGLVAPQPVALHIHGLRPLVASPTVVRADYQPAAAGPAPADRPVVSAYAQPGGPAPTAAHRQVMVSPQLSMQPQPQPVPVPAARERSVVFVSLGALGAFALAAAFWVLAGGPPRGAAFEESRSAPASPTASPGPNASAAANAAAADAALLTSCLRSSTQIIASARRDQILLDMVKTYDVGQRERAHALLKEYTHEACDRATFEMLSILEQEVSRRTKER